MRIFFLEKKSFWKGKVEFKLEDEHQGVKSIMGELVWLNVPPDVAAKQSLSSSKAAKKIIERN